MHCSLRRGSLAGALLLAVAALTAGPAASATATPEAESGPSTFRFWGYYTGSGTGWTFSPTGPDDAVPADGAVEGWRFAVSGAGGDPRPPRAAPDFADICADTPASAGSKRVAVVLDPGLATEAPDGEEPDAPRGACAVLDEDATGSDALAAVAAVRAEGGLVCAIETYPSSECGAPVELPVPRGSDAPVDLASAAEPADAGAQPAPEEEAASSFAGPLGVAVVVLLVTVLGTVAILRRRQG